DKPTKNQHHRKTTTLILNKAGKSKNYYTKKNHNHPQPDGAKKGGSQTTKNDSRNLNAYQTNKLNYLQSRPQKGPIRHTPHQPNTQLSQHNHDHHKVVKSTLAHY
ncbi:hypothetical protein ACL1HK_06815, partial [Corynebacterium striatum]